MSFLPNVLFSFRQWVPPDISLPYSKITFYDIQISTRPNSEGLIIDCKSTVWATGCLCWTIGLILLVETCCILTFWEDWQNPVLWERQVGSVNDFKAVYSDLFCLVLPKTVSSSLKLTTRKCSNSKKPKKKLDCSFFFNLEKDQKKMFMQTLKQQWVFPTLELSEIQYHPTFSFLFVFLRNCSDWIS